MGAATIVVCEFPSLKVVYEASEHVRVTEPYEAGFLAFRESPCILALLAKLHRSCPHLYPQVLLVDGNGILHPRRCGIASTVGVLADLPTIGVAKNLMEIEGLKRKVVATAARAALHRRGDHVPLLSRENGELLGAALKTTDASPRRRPAHSL